MSSIDAIVLGIVQGVAEFLPISSSGHLILAREVLGLQVPEGLAVDATLQLATALAVVLYFRHDLVNLARGAWDMLRGRDVVRETRVLCGALVLGTIPAVIAGLFLEETMDTAFRSAHLVAWVLIAGSVLFIIAERLYARYAERKEITVSTGFGIGLFQVLALVPGMSRSGATIAGGMLLGLSRETTARFSFLLSVPIILGSGGKKLLDLGSAHTPASEWLMIGLAALVAFASGLAAIHFLLSFLKRHTLYAFALYRIIVAIVVLIFV